jgi:hypothetical protein
MIKRIAAVQTSDGTLFLEVDEAKRHEFRFQLMKLFGFEEEDSPPHKVDIADLVARMDDIAKAHKEATEIVEGGRALQGI